MGLEIDGLDPGPSVSQIFFSGGHYCPLWDVVGCHGAGVEALRAGSELVLFSLSVHSPPPGKGSFIPEGSSARGREVGAGTRCGPRHAGALVRNWPELQAVSVCFLRLVPRSQ